MNVVGSVLSKSRMNNSKRYFLEVGQFQNEAGGLTKPLTKAPLGLTFVSWSYNSPSPHLCVHFVFEVYMFIFVTVDI